MEACKSDVCGRPLFANPVTFMDAYQHYISMHMHVCIYILSILTYPDFEYISGHSDYANWVMAVQLEYFVKVYVLLGYLIVVLYINVRASVI